MGLEAIREADAGLHRSSLSISLVVLLLSMVETQVPSGGQAGNGGRLFKRINPIESTVHTAEKVLVNNRPLAETDSFSGSEGFWLMSPLLEACSLVRKEGLGLPGNVPGEEIDLNLNPLFVYPAVGLMGLAVAA
jgi:hypothetical protein